MAGNGVLLEASFEVMQLHCTACPNETAGEGSHDQTPN